MFSQSASVPIIFTREQATAHANFIAQQVKSEAEAEFHSLQHQAKIHVACKIHTIEQKEEEYQQLRQASQQREAELLSELQHNCLHVEGQVAGYARHQQEDSVQRSHQEQLLQEKEAHAQDLHARLEQVTEQHSISLAALGGEQGVNQECIQARLVAYESELRRQADQQHAALVQEAHEAQTVVRQQAQQQIDIMEQQVNEKANALSQ